MIWWFYTFFIIISGEAAKVVSEEVREFYTKIKMRKGLNENTDVTSMVKKLEDKIGKVFNQTRRKGTEEGNEKLDMEIAGFSKEVNEITATMKNIQEQDDMTHIGRKVDAFLNKLQESKETLQNMDNANDQMKIELLELIDQYTAKFKPIQKSLIDGEVPTLAARKKVFKENGKLKDIIEIKVPMLRQKTPSDTISFKYPIADDGTVYADKVRTLFMETMIARHEMKNREKELKHSMDNKIRLTKQVLRARMEMKALDLKNKSLQKLVAFLRYSKLMKTLER